jgi:hypothetical protein
MEIRYYGDKLSQRIAKTPEGFLICQDVPISRTGYQEYLAKEIMDNPINENKVIYVYRPAKEVFDIRSLASFEGKPVTNEHPEEDVTPENYNKYSCGHVQNVHVGEGEDSNKVLADLYITDPVLIKLIEDGKREVSCGYYAEEKKDGDGRLCQTKIRGNHVAVVRSGRAGNKVCIRDHNPFADNHVNSLSDYIDGLRYIKDEGKNRITKAKNKKRNAFNSLKHFYGDERMNYYDDDEVMYDDDEILEDDEEVLEDDDELMYDDDEILEDDDEIMYDDDEILEDDDDIMYDDDEILGDDDELITDAGVKGMKKGQHVKARDPEYLAALKGGAVGAGAAAAGYGAYKGGKALFNKNREKITSGAKKLGSRMQGTRVGHAIGSGINKITSGVTNLKNGVTNLKNKAVNAHINRMANFWQKHPKALEKYNSALNKAGKPLSKIEGFVKAHPTAFKRGALGAGIAAAGGIGAAIGARRNRGDSWYYDDDELMYDNDELMLDDDDIMYDDDELLEDACKYHDEDEILEDDDDIMYDDDELLEDEDEELLDDDELLEDEDEELLDDDELLEDEDEEIPMSDADEVIQNAKEAIADARYAINKINRRLRDSEVVSDIEDDEEELLDDDEILEDDDDIMYDDDELLEDEDEELLDDDEELLDDDELLEDEDEEILEDDEDELLDDDEVLEDDDEILEDDDDIMYDDDELLEDDDDIMYDDDELLEDDDLEVTETEDIRDDNPEADAIDLDKTKALREITEASRGVTDPNERKQLQDAIYGALCKKSQMSDIMRVTKRNKAARMDSAYNSKKVSVADQQAIYDSFNPHKKTSF